jgi:beta-glucanase (GH16 family)
MAQPFCAQAGVTSQAGATAQVGASAYTDADLVWKDDFNGDKLNMSDWNYEYHAPGWVNNELQEYVDAAENLYVKDGTLVIQAVKKTGADGKATYTSGRVNTQRKHDFTYGRFEAKLKVPNGKGFLPAFWMMPTEENLYGQWPKCGEIDIMEVLGDATTKNYGTLHFGEPHAQRQGTYALSSGDFSKEFHVYAVEWDPGEMRFYIDGNFYYKTGDWFTKRNGFGEVTYPAPFDQNFYMILNVAVGGNWPGNPDDSTKFAENARLVVDYVKVYQKKAYDENVEKPVAIVAGRKVDANGNYVANSGFTATENLADGTGWDFLIAGKGKATAEISGGALNIATTDSGELDYSVQVVQPNIYLEKGCKYRYSFEAWSDADRTILPAITAPNAGWVRYFPDTKTVITTERKTYSFDFTMRAKDDPTARVEFNLGNQGSTATVHITNVAVVMTRDKDKAKEAKTILPDGNFIYNGEFQEGKDRLESWNVVNDTEEGVNEDISVTNVKNVRELKVTAPAGTKDLALITVSQGDLALKNGTTYVLSFDAYADSVKTVNATIAGKTFKIALTKTKKAYKNKFTVKSEDETQELAFLLGAAGTTYIDNVRVQEDGLIINGSFSSGMTAYEVYMHEAAKVDYAVDTLSEDGAFCANISNTGDQDWMIQLKQNNIVLEKGKWYTLSFDAKSSLPRTIMYALQRDGSGDNNWLPYSGTQKIDIGTAFKRYSIKFQMIEATDAATILSVSFGAVNGKAIDVKHTVAIDNIRLEETKK